MESGLFICDLLGGSVFGDLYLRGHQIAQLCDTLLSGTRSFMRDVSIPMVPKNDHRTRWMGDQRPSGCGRCRSSRCRGSSNRGSFFLARRRDVGCFGCGSVARCSCVLLDDAEGTCPWHGTVICLDGGPALRFGL